MDAEGVVMSIYEPLVFTLRGSNNPVLRTVHIDISYQ